MSARESILSRLKSAAPAVLPEPPDVQSWAARRRPIESVAEGIARLRTALEAARAEVHLTDAETWRGRLFEVVEARNLRSLLVGADMELEFPPASACRVIRYEQVIERWRDQLFDDIDAGLTRAKSAIAETGSLVLWPDAAEPRLMSLVPPVHIVLLDAASIHADLSAAMAAENWTGTLPANALLISGPSKTADIQQTLAYGAHGPREVIVLILQPAGGES